MDSILGWEYIFGTLKTPIDPLYKSSDYGGLIEEVIWVLCCSIFFFSVSPSHNCRDPDLWYTVYYQVVINTMFKASVLEYRIIVKPFFLVQFLKKISNIVFIKDKI